MTITEEDIREMERVRAFTNALPAVRARVTKEPIASFPDDPPSPPPKQPPPPAPGEPGFQVPGMAPPVMPPVMMNIPSGAGQIDLSDMPPPPPKGGNPPAAPPSAVPPPAPQGQGPFPPPAPAQVIPGGMQPYTEEREVKYGKPVPPGVRAAIGQAGNLEMDAAKIDRDANADLHMRERDMALAKVAAGETAAAQQQRLAEERSRIVGARLAEIEALNKKAQGDPEDLWSSPVVFGRLIGALSMGLGVATMASGGKNSLAAGAGLMMSGQFVNGLIDQDIRAKIDQRKQAGELAARQTSLLHLHEENLGSQSKAIEATKLAYYDNILQQMETYKAAHAGAINEGAYNNIQAGILKQQAETANRLAKQDESDITDHLVNKMRQPQVVGGGAGGAMSRPEHLVTLPDGTSVTFPKEVLATAVKKIDGYTQLIRMNEEILEKRNEIRKLNAGVTDIALDPEKYARMRALGRQIDDTVESKIKIMSKSEDESVVREAEKEAAIQSQAGGTRGLGVVANRGFTGAYEKGHDEMLQNQNKRFNAGAYGFVKAGGGDIVEKGFGRDTQGNMVPTGRFTGQTVGPDEGLAPKSFKPLDPRREVAKAEEPLFGTAKRAPYQGQILPTPAAHHSKKKK